MAIIKVNPEAHKKLLEEKAKTAGKGKRKTYSEIIVDSNIGEKEE